MLIPLINGQVLGEVILLKYSNHEAISNLIGQLKVYKQGTNTNPHKYLLILALISIIKEEVDHENKFTFEELEPIFREQFQKYFPHYADYRKMLEYPFYHLQNDGFWFFKLKAGMEEKYSLYEEKRLTRKRLLETVEYAYLSEAVYAVIKDSEQSELLENAIMNLLDVKYEVTATMDSIVQEGSLFEHEQKAIEIIENYTRRYNIGQLLHNIYLYDRQSNNYYEYDIILIARSGIYVVELKHWSGEIKVSPYHWVVNETQYRNDPHKNNSFKCKILKGLYQHQFPTYPRLWVESVVALTNPVAVVEGACIPSEVAEQELHNPTFASIEDLLTFIKQKDRHGPSILDDGKIQAISSYLQSLHTPRKGIKFSVPGYETVEYLSQRPYCIELLARPTGIRAKRLHRFRIFRLPMEANELERERFFKKAHNTLNAVSQMSDHPNIHKVWITNNDVGDIIEGAEWSETGTLRDLIQKNNGAFPVETALDICHGIARGLEHAHQANIIHRAVKPENIVMLNGIPKLLNFDLAYQVEDNHITVITDSSQLEDDGYIAPELLAGQDIDEGTDFFSLGVIAYELLTGFKPFARVRQFVAEGGALTRERLERLEHTGATPELIEVIEAMLQVDRTQRLRDIEYILNTFCSQSDTFKPDSSLSPVNAPLEPGDSHDLYEILEIIGQGATAQIYKARTIRSQEVALKLFNQEVPQGKIVKEGEITSSVKSTYVVGYKGIGHWEKDRYFLVLDYIDGESMRDWIDRGERPDLETFRTVARCLMEAIAAFHLHKDETGTPQPLLHSDIKPDNILITRDRKAVLIDCGIAGEPRTDVFQGTSPYIPPDCIRGADMLFSADGDLFALGVTLWEWLLGNRPYEQPVIGETPDYGPETWSRLPDELREWMIQAVATDKDSRFESIEHMREAFTGNRSMGDEVVSVTQSLGGGQPVRLEDKVDTEPISSEVKPDTKAVDAGNHYNFFVSYLNSLSNTSAGNENATAESQLTSAYFDRIRVENPVTDYIFDQVCNKQKNVILTGNAGDGKTTIAAEIFKRLTGDYRPLEPREEPQPGLFIIKDLSELEDNERSFIFQEAMENDNKRFLIVSNTGILLESLKRTEVKTEIVQSELLKALEAGDPTPVLGDSFKIINLGRIDSIEPAVEVFERMLNAGDWCECGTCPLCAECPIYTNVRLLQENQEVVCSRFKLVYQRLYEYGSRLTMRQMTGHLAYTITSGLDCRDIAKMSHIARQERLHEYLCFNRFFGDNGSDVVPEAMQLIPVQHIRHEEFGIFLEPAAERVLWESDSLDSLLAENAKKVFNKIKDLSTVRQRIIRLQSRRLLFFFASLQGMRGKRYITTFLRSPMLLTYLKYVETNQAMSDIEKNKYRGFILQVLQEYFIGIRLPEEGWKSHDLYITINPPGHSSTQMILKRLQTEDFNLGRKPLYKIGDIKSNILTLRFREENIELELDLPFLDYVACRYQGEVAEQLSAYYADRLEQFKAQLLEEGGGKPGEQHSLQLLHIGANRNFQVVTVNVTGDHLEVLL